MHKTLALLGVAVAALVSFGIVLLASASTVRAQSLHGDPLFFAKRQMVWLALAVAVAVFASFFDYHLWKKTPLLVVGFYAAVVIALLLVFCPGIGAKVNGSYRWLKFGPVRMQPGEFGKILVVVGLAVWMEHVGRHVRQWREGALYPALGLGLIAVLLIAEPDFGAAMVVLVIGGAMMFVAGTRFKHLLVLGGAGIAGMVGVLATNENRVRRIVDWLLGTGVLDWLKGSRIYDGLTVLVTKGAEAASNAATHQTEQAIIAFKNGGLFGVGIFNSLQKYNYLPEAHTDFIFPIGGEEFGFFASIGVVLAFMTILICGFRISMRAPDRLGGLLALGMTVLIVFQAAFNILVVVGWFPPKGLALPFISYGGTNIITALFAVGTLFNVGKHVDVFDERLHTQVVRNAIDQV